MVMEKNLTKTQKTNNFGVNMVKLPDYWVYISFRTDIHDHCQVCNKETNELHWYRMNEKQVATVCDACKKQSDKEKQEEKEEN